MEDRRPGTAQEQEELHHLLKLLLFHSPPPQDLRRTIAECVELAAREGYPAAVKALRQHVDAYQRAKD